MGRLFQNIILRAPGRLLAAAIIPFAVNQAAHAQRAEPQTVCSSHAVAEAFKTQMRTWSMQQRLLASRVERGHDRPGIWWTMRNTRALPTQAGGDVVRAKSTYWCEADFKYWAVPIAMMANIDEQFTIEKVAYTVSLTARGLTQPVVELRNLPDSINTEETLIGMRDRVSISGHRVSDILDMMRADAEAKATRGRQSPPAPAQQSRPPQPRNVVEGLAQVDEQYQHELEAEMRRQGAGDIIDAEKARRARLTPAQRAAEDAWNIGPRKGETMCREENGITRCKTG